RPKMALLILTLLVLAACWFARDFKLDASSDSLVQEGDGDLEYYRQMNARYGTRDFVFITFNPAGELFSDANISRLRALNDDLAQLDRVESIDSILTVPLFEVGGMTLTRLNVDNLLTLESPGVDLDQARNELASSQAYQDVLISEDGETAALVVNFVRNQDLIQAQELRTELRNLAAAGSLTPVQRQELDAISRLYDQLNDQAQQDLHEDITRIRGILDSYRDNAEIVMGGVPMIADDLISFVKSDLINFGSAIVVFIILSLSYLFRKLRYVLVPLLCSTCTALLAVGMLGLLDWRVTVVSSNFISLLLIITISLTVHLMVRYRELEQEEPDITHQQRLRLTLQNMIRPCAYTSLTTIVAFGSLVVSDIPPIVDFGWMMVVGIIIAFCLTFTLFPSILALMPANPSVRTIASFINLTPALAKLTDRRGGRIVIASALLLLISTVGISRLQVEN
ncbi:MAG: MMPL family transporter, partial [Pseudohongiellaceae bacterium]